MTSHGWMRGGWYKTGMLLQLKSRIDQYMSQMDMGTVQHPDMDPEDPVLVDIDKLIQQGLTPWEQDVSREAAGNP